ncbi:hypothetical protein MAR_008322 [Mya arenaria]|uniref:Uncharacterized protein n=1 Tax=Mya arenaria TaxID=6604 RepID=A0ABY7DXL8_MYAAR|nr:hypothetical protein MAR_008322 [Mya arenaria]
MKRVAKGPESFKVNNVSRSEHYSAKCSYCNSFQKDVNMQPTKSDRFYYKYKVRVHLIYVH